MSLSYKFKNELGQTFIMTWGLILDASIPNEIKQGQGSAYISNSTIFKQSGAYSDNGDANAWGKVFPNNKYIAIGESNDDSIFKHDVDFIGHTWTCENGNYFYLEPCGPGAKTYFYNKSGKVVNVVEWQMFSFWGEAWKPVYSSYESFIQSSVPSKMLTGIGAWRHEPEPISQNVAYLKACTLRNLDFWADPFRAVLFMTGDPPEPAKPNDPFSPITPNDNGNQPNGEFDQNGEFNDIDDKIDDTQLPPDTASAVGTGFISLYTPNYAQLTSLASFLWSPGFVDTVSKLFANPFEVIMNLHTMPFTVPAGATQNIKCGNVDTKIVAPLVASQYFTFDFGTVEIPKYSGTYLDYSPYTSYKITLPYMTTYSLNTDEITGKTLGLKYHVDVATGDTVAVISVDGEDTYTFTGNIATNIPITQGDYTNFWTTLTKATFDTAKTAVAVGTGGATQATGSIGALSSAVETVMSQKPEISTSGVLGSNFGNFGTLRPYITKIKPNLLIPENQQTYTGWASYFVTSIGDCKGYNQFTDIILNGFEFATDEEKAMIKSELEKGVIL